MSIEIKSPTFPESEADGTIANWVKKEGESVKQDEVIAEIETDKVVLEVVAPFDGIISKVLKPAGEIVLSAELIAEFDDECFDTTMTSTNHFIPYEELYAAIVDSAGLTMLNISWNVYASDAWEDVPSTNGPFSLW